MNGRPPAAGRPARGAALVRETWRIGDTRPPPGNDDPHAQQCRKLLETLRRHCPDWVPAPPLPPGETGEPVTVDGRLVQTLALTAAIGAAGIDGPDGEPTAPGVVWVDGENELFVAVTKVQVLLAPGAIAVTLPVSCDQVGQVDVHVTFAVGSPGRPLGMVAATEDRPRGPREVVDLWGEALTAFAWQVVLDVSAGTAAHAGQDLDGAFLLPAALAATGDGITVLPQARHAFDRAVR
jgi:hypothetical protein